MSGIDASIRVAALTLALACGAATAAQPSGQACLDPGGIGGTGAPAVAGGVGGTGAPAADSRGSGIGGTGAALAQAPGGMGGTGDPAHGGVGGTGIVGTITGFASICVNGAEVHYDTGVPVTENGVAASLGRLAVGQVVAVEAGPSPRGLEAMRISILHVLEGPLSALPRGDEPMRVMDQPVRLAPDAHLVEGLRMGETVRVSGLRNAQGEVVATRVDRAPRLAQSSAIGAVAAGGDLQGLPLAGARLPAGGEMLVRGRWNGTALEVEHAEPDPSVPFAGRVRHALVEGLVHEREPGRIVLGGFSVTLEPGASVPGGDYAALSQGRRLRVSGEFRGPREVQASRIEFMSLEYSVRPPRERRETRRDDDGRKQKERKSRERLERDRPADDDVDLPDERYERRERGEKSERSERLERTDRPERSDRPEKAERIDRIERPEKD